MEASPTVVSKSAAICGNSESVTRTIAWLAKPATASRMIERVGTWSGLVAAVTCGLSVMAARRRGHAARPYFAPWARVQPRLRRIICGDVDRVGVAGFLPRN